MSEINFLIHGLYRKQVYQLMARNRYSACPRNFPFVTLGVVSINQISLYQNNNGTKDRTVK